MSYAWNMISSFFFGVSCLGLVVCSALLFSGWCIRQNDILYTREFHLEFISTQMGACLDAVAWITYGVVVCSGIQMLYLLQRLLLCMKGAGMKKEMRIWRFTVSNADVALFCSVLIANFAINMTAVAEFRSDSDDTAERTMHYFAAVCAIILFWAIHVLIAVFLHSFAHTDSENYKIFRLVYASLAVVFFILWVAQQRVHAAMLLEWLILCNAFFLQWYSLYILQKHTDVLESTSKIYLNTYKVISVQISNYLSWVFFGIFFAPPWFWRYHLLSSTVHTGPEFWTFVFVFSISVTLLLLRQSTPYAASLNA